MPYIVGHLVVAGARPLIPSRRAKSQHPKRRKATGIDDCEEGNNRRVVDSIVTAISVVVELEIGSSKISPIQHSLSVSTKKSISDTQ